MGKFCVKAAIVSSLAIAEEDYDNTVGAPIVLKRNLVARSLKEGKKPEILSDASTRALEVVQNNQGEGCLAKLSNCWTTNGKSLLDNKGDNIIQTIGNIGNKAVDTVISQAGELKTTVDGLEKDIDGWRGKSADEIKEKWNDSSNKIRPYLTLLEMSKGLLPDPAKTLLGTLTTKLDEVGKVVKGLEEDTENKVDEVINNIKTYFTATKTEVDNLTTEVKKIANKTNKTLNKVNAIAKLTKQITHG